MCWDAAVAGPRFSAGLNSLSSRTDTGALVGGGTGTGFGFPLFVIRGAGRPSAAIGIKTVRNSRATCSPATTFN